jgi:glutathione S-transferase
MNSRRVWIALLEKQLDFELIELKLNGDQFQYCSVRLKNVLTREM